MSNRQNQLMNAAQGIIGSSLGSGLAAQSTLTSAQQNAYNQAITSGASIYREEWLSPRVRVDVERVSNGYVVAVGSERLIAKDLEELQQHFTAQVVSKLVLEGDK